MDGLFKNFENKKLEHSYFEQQVQDAELIDIKTQVQNDNFSDLEQLFNEVSG